MEKDFKTKLTQQVFDEYFKDGEIVEFATLKALWDAIDHLLISNKVKFMKGGYKAFLNTIYWKTVSEEVKRRAGYKCQLCGSDENLNTHHRCYDHKGIEVLHMNDLVCLCQKCHDHHHNGYDRIENLEIENMEVKRLKKVNEELVYKYKALEESKPFIVSSIPSEKAHEYFDNMDIEELRRNCMQLYDTFMVLRDCQYENIELKKQIYRLKDKLPIKKWERYDGFDYPNEDEDDSIKYF